MAKKARAGYAESVTRRVDLSLCQIFARMDFECRELVEWDGLILRRIRRAREEATCIPRGAYTSKGSVYRP